MKRRNFIVGLGALSAGGAAAVGSGAFTSAVAKRDVSVEVADDSEAYLALESNDEYAIENSDGTLELDFSQEVSGEGSHVGERSAYVFGKGNAWENPENGLFTVKNQGTKDVEIEPQFEEQFFDSNGVLIANNKSTDTSNHDAEDPPEGTELFFATYNKYYEGPATLTPGDETGFYVVVSAGSDAPDEVESTFEISANEV